MCISQGAWNKSSGNIPNSGKSFFLKLVAAAVRDVKMQLDKNGIRYTRKAMVLNGLSSNYNGMWEERHLKNELQVIFAKNREYFNGNLGVHLE